MHDPAVWPQTIVNAEQERQRNLLRAQMLAQLGSGQFINPARESQKRECERALWVGLYLGFCVDLPAGAAAVALMLLWKA